MADPHGLSPGPTRYFTPSSRNQFQELDELYNRLTKIADDEFISEESQLNEECHAQQVAFLRRTDLPEDVGEKLRELLVENRDLRIDKLRWVYDAKKATIMKQKKLEEPQKLTLTSFTKKRKPDGGRDDVLLPGPEFISERTKRPRKSDMGRSAPLIVIPQSRVINFEDVHQGGNPQFMHTIIKWEDGRFYILYCEEHGVHFRQRALTGAAKHLDSYAHGHMARFHHLALEKLGYLISDCDEEKQARHNTIVTQSFEQGYIIPSSESLLKPDNAWPAAQNNQPLQSPVVIDTDASTPAPAPEPVPLVAEQSQPAASNPTVEGVRKGPLHTKSGKRKSLSHKKTEVITNPVAGGLYYATPKAKLGDRPKKYIVMILAWKDLSHCGLPGRTLGQLELIKQAKRKECYLYDAEGISGWSPDYEDDGKQVKKRWFPVIWFEGNRTEDNREGWVRAEELSNFDLLPAPKRGAYHPETRAREWYYRSHPEQAHIFWDRIKASRTIEKSSELKSGVDAASAVVVEDDDPDGADADDADSDGEPAGEEATGRHDLTPVVDHPSDSDYHASDDRDMAESVTSSQHSPPSHPPPSHPPAKKKTIQEVRSKAAEVVIERPVTPIRVGAAAGTRSSTKKQSGGRDVEMTDAPPVAHDELSPLSRRAKGGFADDVNPGQVANVTPQGPAKMSVQLGTPLDNITSKVDVAQTALQEPERPDGSEQVTQQQMAKVAEMAAYLAQATQEHQAHQQQNDNEALESPATPKTVDSELLEVVDQARRRVTDQVYQNIVKEAIQGLLSQENASPGTADQASDKAQANHGTKDDVEASNEETHQPLQDANDDNEAVSSTVKHGGDLISMAMSIPPSPVTYQATAASSPSEAIDGKVADEAQEKTEETTQKKKKASVSLEGPETPASLIGESMAGSLTEDAAPSEKPTNGASTNGNLNSNSTNGDNVNGECAAQAADQVEPVVASTSPHTVDPIDRWRAVRTSHSPAVTPAVVKTSATEGEPTATKTTSAPISPAQAPATIKGSSALPAGSGSVPGSRLSTPMAQTPPVQSPRMQSPAVKRDTEAAGVVWQVSGIQQGNRRWSDATHTLRLVVDEAGVAKTSESDEMDATVNPQAIQSVHYSQSGDKSRAEVILMPRTGTVEQKLTFTVGAGRSKMQSFKFVRWLRQANPDITLVDGPKLRI
ncbi:hypothetical protein ACHAQA_005748 [Verticillium albo-atrum]